MTPPKIIAGIVGAATFAFVAKWHWDIVTGFAYPMEVGGNRWDEVKYTVSERIHPGVSAVLFLLGPAVMAAVAYVFAVGLWELMYG